MNDKSNNSLLIFLLIGAAVFWVYRDQLLKPLAPCPTPAPCPLPSPLTPPRNPPLDPNRQATEVVIVWRPGCPACQSLKANWPSSCPLIATWFNTDEPEGKEFARLFGITSLPTMVKVDKQKREITRHVGNMSRPELLAWLEQKSEEGSE